MNIEAVMRLAPVIPVIVIDDVAKPPARSPKHSSQAGCSRSR